MTHPKKKEISFMRHVISVERLLSVLHRRF